MIFQEDGIDQKVEAEDINDKEIKQFFLSLFFKFITNKAIYKCLMLFLDDVYTGYN